MTTISPPPVPATSALEGRTVLLVGTGGINRELARRVVADGGRAVLAGRSTAGVAPLQAELGGQLAVHRVDLRDEASVRALAEETGPLDHLVAGAAAPANGPVTDLRREDVLAAFDAKVVGPLLLVKHLAARFRPGGSVLLFSGVVAWRPQPERVVMAAANGAVDFLVRALAVELAPVRVNALSPGITDSGAWDTLGDGRRTFLQGVADRNPTGRVGDTDDIVQAAVLALTNPFMTGATLHVDGGGRLV